MEILDTLIVKLGLDTSDYTKGRKEVESDTKKTKDLTHSAGKEIEASGKRAASFFSGMRSEAVQLFAAFTGAKGLKEFISGTIEGNAQVGRLAANIGVSTEKLSAWSNVAGSFAGKESDVMNAFQLANRWASNKQTMGFTGIEPDLMFLDVDVENLKSREDLLLRIAEGASKLPRPIAFDRLGQMGFSEPMINMLLQGRTALENLVEQQRRLRPANQESADAAIAFAAAQNDLTKAVRGGSQPALTWLANHLTALIKDTPVLTGLMVGLGIAAAIAFEPLIAAVAPVVALAAVLGATGAAVGKGYEIWSGMTDAEKTKAKSGTWDALKQLFGGRGPGSAEKAWDIYKKAWAPSGKPPSAASAGGVGDDNAQWFQKHGVAVGTSLGIAAGIYGEGGTATAENPTSGAYGIGQWLGSRVANFKRVMHRDLRGSTLEQQREFMLWELNGGDHGGAGVARAPDADKALRAYVEQFMRPAKGRETAGDLRQGRAHLRAMAAGARGSGSNTTVNIGTVTTQATDAAGIARDLPPAIKRRGLTTHANTAVN